MIIIVEAIQASCEKLSEGLLKIRTNLKESQKLNFIGNLRTTMWFNFNNRLCQHTVINPQ